jgi:hypothetical protein
MGVPGSSFHKKLPRPRALVHLRAAANQRFPDIIVRADPPRVDGGARQRMFQYPIGYAVHRNARR